MTFEYVYALEGYCIVQVDGVLDDRTILSLLEFWTIVFNKKFS